MLPLDRLEALVTSVLAIRGARLEAEGARLEAEGP